MARLALAQMAIIPGIQVWLEPYVVGEGRSLCPFAHLHTVLSVLIHARKLRDKGKFGPAGGGGGVASPSLPSSDVSLHHLTLSSKVSRAVCNCVVTRLSFASISKSHEPYPSRHLNPIHTIIQLYIPPRQKAHLWVGVS